MLYVQVYTGGFQPPDRRTHERLRREKIPLETEIVTTETTRSPFFGTMQKIPGGLMLVPLILGSLIGTFAPDALAIGGFTTALFKNSALPLIALLIFATGTQVNTCTGGPILATAGTILLMKTLVPATLIIILGSYVGLDGVLGVSILAMLAPSTTATAACGWPTPASTAMPATAAPTSPARSMTAPSSACCSWAPRAWPTFP